MEQPLGAGLLWLERQLQRPAAGNRLGRQRLEHLGVRPVLGRVPAHSLLGGNSAALRGRLLELVDEVTGDFAFGIYFVYSAMNEEKTMAAEFPAQYERYREQTKMLVPYVL